MLDFEMEGHYLKPFTLKGNSFIYSLKKAK